MNIADYWKLTVFIIDGIALILGLKPVLQAYFHNLFLRLFYQKSKYQSYIPFIEISPRYKFRTNCCLGFCLFWCLLFVFLLFENFMHEYNTYHHHSLFSSPPPRLCSTCIPYNTMFLFIPPPFFKYILINPISVAHVVMGMGLSTGIWTNHP